MKKLSATLLFVISILLSQQLLAYQTLSTHIVRDPNTILAEPVTCERLCRSEYKNCLSDADGSVVFEELCEISYEVCKLGCVDSDDWTDQFGTIYSDDESTKNKNLVIELRTQLNEIIGSTLIQLKTLRNRIKNLK